MKKHRYAFLLPAGLLFVCGSSALADETVYVPGQELLLMDQEEIQVTLQGDALSAEPEDGIVKFKAEVKNGTDQDVNIWYSGTLNGQDLSEKGWYLCSAPAHSGVQTVISNQDPILTVLNAGDVVSLQLHFTVYDANASVWFEQDSETVLFETESGELDGQEIASETDYPEYSGSELLAFLDALPQTMETVKTGAADEILQLRFADRAEDQMIGGFSVYSPSVSAKEIRAKLLDLKDAADWLVFDLYDFQREVLDAYTDRTAIDLELLNTQMHAGWDSFKGLDFASGVRKAEDRFFYWMPVYYAAEDGECMNDEIYLYVYEVVKGADGVLLDQLGVYDPGLEAFHTEQFLLTDRATVLSFLNLLQMEQDLEHSDADVQQYETLREDSEGDAVRNIQNRLSDLGYMDSSVDGYYGPMTKEAVEAFQSEAGLEVTGEADGETQKILLAEQDERQLLSGWMQRDAK